MFCKTQFATLRESENKSDNKSDCQRNAIRLIEPVKRKKEDLDQPWALLKE